MREGFVDSERVNNLDYDEECFYHRLLLKVDDAGRYDGRIEILRSILFPLGYKTHSDPVKRGLDGCDREGLIFSYDVAGKAFLQVTNWRRCSNAKLSKWPDQNGDYTIRFVKMDTNQGIKDFVDTSVRSSDQSRVSPPHTPPLDTNVDEDGDGDGKTRPHADGVGIPSASHPPSDEENEKYRYLKTLRSVPMLRFIQVEQWLTIKRNRSEFMDWDKAIAHVVNRAELKADITDPADYVDNVLSRYEVKHRDSIETRRQEHEMFLKDLESMVEIAGDTDEAGEARYKRMKAHFYKRYGKKAKVALGNRLSGVPA